LEIEILECKILKCIDTSKTPNVQIVEDIPKTELQLAQERIEALESYVLEKETDSTEIIK
jgi:hypothetical protein